MNKKQATASLAIVGMALLATITMVSPTQALASASLDDVEFQECLDELGDSPEEEEEEQVLYCTELGYRVQEDSDTPNEGADEDDEDDTNVD
jgi:hypothetical protein